MIESFLNKDTNLNFSRKKATWKIFSSYIWDRFPHKLAGQQEDKKMYMSIKNLGGADSNSSRLTFHILQLEMAQLCRFLYVLQDVGLFMLLISKVCCHFSSWSIIGVETSCFNADWGGLGNGGMDLIETKERVHFFHTSLANILTNVIKRLFSWKTIEFRYIKC